MAAVGITLIFSKVPKKHDGHRKINDAESKRERVSEL